MSEREDWINLIRNEYDPKPDLGRASYPAFDAEWDDGAGRIADAIIADKTLFLRKQSSERIGEPATGAGRVKIKYWWSEDRKWFCILSDDGINQTTISLTPEEASLLSMNAILEGADA